MKIQKFNEEVERQYDVAEQLSIKFFESSGNFGSEEIILLKSSNTELVFYFMMLDSSDLDRLNNCKKYIPKYLDFFVTHSKHGLKVCVILTQDFLKLLEEKLELDKSTKKYNL
jgi:hypothetical protein